MGELSAESAVVSQSFEGLLNTLKDVSIAVSEPRLDLQRGKWGEATKYFRWWDHAEDGNEDDEFQACRMEGEKIRRPTSERVPGDLVAPYGRLASADI